MTPEITVLTFAGLLQIVQFAVYSVIARRQVGNRAALGPRDTAIELTGTAGRAQRAMNNHFEALILFTIATLVVVLGEAASPLTVTMGWLYLAARVLYIPAYAFGWAPWRSYLWALGLLATVIMLMAALF